MKIYNIFRALVLLLLSSFGFKAYAENIYWQSLLDRREKLCAKVSFSEGGRPSGNWSVEKDAVKVGSGNWTVEQLMPVQSDRWIVYEDREMLILGKWKSSSYLVSEYEDHVFNKRKDISSLEEENSSEIIFECSDGEYIYCL